MKLRMVSPIVAALLSAASLAFADGKMAEGEWEITTQMTIPGMPFQPPATTVKQCITKKDPAPHPHKQQGQCELSKVQVDGNKVSWQVKCTGERHAEGSGEVVYSGETMEGKSTFKMENPHTHQPMEAQQTIKGRRLGDCPKK